MLELLTGQPVYYYVAVGLVTAITVAGVCFRAALRYCIAGLLTAHAIERGRVAIIRSDAKGISIVTGFEDPKDIPPAAMEVFAAPEKRSGLFGGGQKSAEQLKISVEKPLAP